MVLKIAQLCYLFSPAVGGVETHVLNIGSNLAQWGHSVDVLTSDFLALNGSQRVESADQMVGGVHVYRFRGRAVARTRAYAQRLRFPSVVRRLLTTRYDLIHCHSIASLHYDIAWWVAKLRRIPIVVTGHYSPDDLDRLWNKRRKWGPLTYWTARLLYWRTWMSFALPRTDAVIAIVASERARMIELWGLDPAKVVVIPNGVNPDEFDAVDEDEVEGFRRSHGYGAEPLVLFVGRISRVKGPDIFLEAAEQLLDEGSRTQFLVAGYGEDAALYDRLAASVAAHRGSGRLRLLELPRRELIMAFKACDVVVLPSRGEVFGITLVEGMYCGKVVIGSDSGGIPEVVQDGESGFLFKSGDSADLARVLKLVLENLGSLDHIRQAAHQRVCDLYTWDSAARKLLAVYTGLVS